MERMREKIRAALAANPVKSRKELAKFLEVSPTQVSSLLKSGGRYLRAVEVRIVENYLGITLLDGQEKPQPPDEAGSDELLDARALKLPRLRGPAPEGNVVSLNDLPGETARYFGSIAGRCDGEVWQLTTGHVQLAGYLSGDYVVIDRTCMPRPKEVVLAELRDGPEAPVPIFRVYVPPYLMMANPRAMLQSPLLVDDERVAIIGPVVAAVRIRE